MRDGEGNILKEGHKVVLDTGRLGGLGQAKAHIAKLPSVLALKPGEAAVITLYLTIHIPVDPRMDVIDVITLIDCAENRAMAGAPAIVEEPKGVIDLTKPIDPPAPVEPEKKSPLAI